MKTTLRIGTRGSPLALAQAHEVRDRLHAAWPDTIADIEIVVLSTQGDRVLDRPLAEIGGKGLFTEEIEAGLLDGSLDLAVHSMKDMPTALPHGLTIAALLPREDPADTLLVRDGVLAADAGDDPLRALPQGARVGTSSLRRAAQLRALRPDLEVVGFRGNVQTRLRKLAEGVADATMLARAGLRRLGLELGHDLPTARFLPAVAQGAIGVECRVDDPSVRALLAPIHCDTTGARVGAERAMLALLDGSCRTPIAGLATIGVDGAIALYGLLAEDDGSRVWRAEATGSEPIAVGELVAEALLRARAAG
jgi:hydroxymethylbilane synthase